MGVDMLLLAATLFTVSHAVRLPYLGGDIQDVLQNSRQGDMSDPSAAWIAANKQPIEPRPITMKQKRDSTKYNSKFTDIARAYAEGYKAAIKAVQQRALIAKRRLHGFKPIVAAYPRRPMLPQIVKSTIPSAPIPQILKMQAPVAPNNPKSIIPLPEVPEQIPGVGESKEVSNPGPSSDHETQTLPTLNGLPDSKSALEEMVARSTIPEAPKVPEAAPEEHKEEKKSDIPSADAMFAAAISPQTTENGFPGAESPSFDSPLNMNERSTHVEMPKYKQEDHPAFLKVPVHMRSQEDRDKIARMNARARHRSVVFDGAGGDPFNGGGVLSMQNAISVTKKHRRRRRRNSDNDDNDWYFVPNPHYLTRHRRSRMPYLGQNLDALGVVRATPKSWMSAVVKKSEKSKHEQMLPAAMAAYNQPEMAPSAEMGPNSFSQTIPAQYRADIPQAPVPMMTSPMALNYAGGMFPQQQFAYRSMIPSYPAFFNQMAPGPFGFPFQSPVPSGFMGETDANVETNTKPLEEIREKKSYIPLTEQEQQQQQLETATLNL